MQGNRSDSFYRECIPRLLQVSKKSPTTKKSASTSNSTSGATTPKPLAASTSPKSWWSSSFPIWTRTKRAISPRTTGSMPSEPTAGRITCWKSCKVQWPRLFRVRRRRIISSWKMPWDWTSRRPSVTKALSVASRASSLSVTPSKCSNTSGTNVLGTPKKLTSQIFVFFSITSPSQGKGRQRLDSHQGRVSIVGRMGGVFIRVVQRSQLGNGMLRLLTMWGKLWEQRVNLRNSCSRNLIREGKVN